MTIEEMLRAGEVRTADNGLVFAIIPESGPDAPSAPNAFDPRGLERMVAAVPRSLVPHLGRSATYFVPWLRKQRRSVVVATAPAPDAERKNELCHHLDTKPDGNLLLVSLGFYQHDSYGLAMEFFDKIAYLATLAQPQPTAFEQLLRKQLAQGKPGELTHETWEWRSGLAEADPATEATAEAWSNYSRAAETDAFGLYMASLYTDIFYEDLFDEEPSFPPLAPELVYERVRAAERLFPPNRGFSFQVVRHRTRHRPAANAR